MKRAVVITNPQASRVEGGALDVALRHLRSGGLAVEVQRTARRGHGEGLARAALADGADLVIAHGGDGTIMEVAAAMAGGPVPLGLLPAGTGNRLADNLGIGWETGDAVTTILAGKTRALDLGRLTTSEGARYFAVTAGCGFDADLMHRTGSAAKRDLGIGAYVAAAMKMGGAITRAHVQVETDRELWAGQVAMVLVANCASIIPLGSPMAPGIRPDDGELDVLLVDFSTFADAARVAWKMVIGEADRDEAVTILRARRVSVAADPPLPSQADGEPHGHTPLAAELVAGGLTVLAPPAP